MAELEKVLKQIADILAKIESINGTLRQIRDDQLESIEN
jgi:hypothetical protein